MKPEAGAGHSSVRSSTPENTSTLIFCAGCAGTVESDDPPAEEGTSAYIVFENQMWGNGKTLKYYFMDGYQDSNSVHRGREGSPAEQRKVAEVIREWERYANVKFELTDDPKTAIIRIVFDSDPGSWSRIGRLAETSPREKPTMNLRLDGDLSQHGMDTGVILHEFGHALGLGHEHQSPARIGEFTPVNEALHARINDQTYKNQIGDMHPAEDVVHHPWLDYQSIMMYAFSRHENEQRKAILPNNKLSELDKAYITLHYPFETAKDHEWTVRRALDVIGVDDTYREMIIRSHESRTDDKWRDMRYWLKEWTRGKRFPCDANGNTADQLPERLFSSQSEKQLRGKSPVSGLMPTGIKRKESNETSSDSLTNRSPKRAKVPTRARPTKRRWR